MYVSRPTLTKVTFAIVDKRSKSSRPADRSKHDGLRAAQDTGQIRAVGLGQSTKEAAAVAKKNDHFRRWLDGVITAVDQKAARLKSHNQQERATACGCKRRKQT
mmetsp:Transcript_7914/g.18489  ORF Transcript_7914/g.18489 Transcript_7914/m.18489 type:complete len:104 (+) Transcript_7914:87-398(+)